VVQVVTVASETLVLGDAQMDVQGAVRSPSRPGRARSTSRIVDPFSTPPGISTV
jgi:hypothetical protein